MKTLFPIPQSPGCHPLAQFEIADFQFPISNWQLAIGNWQCSPFRFRSALRRLLWPALLLALLCWAAGAAHAQTTVPNPLPFRVTIDGSNQPQDLDVGIKILAAITLLSLAPSLILLMTCFTRIIIVLSFVRTALQLQGAPSNQIIVGLSLFMTFFIMAPVWDTIQRDAVAPYQAKQITSEQALERAAAPIRTFMLKQARAKDVELFVGLARMTPTEPDKLPLKVVVPGFIISELRTAFTMGFLLLVPFILIDLVVAVVLMSMGMMMMPPMTIALPLKILLFVLADGWGLVVRSIIQSFGT
jgi:flagellar biosynthetic protein FliP